MGQVEEYETVTEKVNYLPVECTAGHQLYLVYFPMLDAYGFACPVCHHLGVNVTATRQQDKIVEVRLVSGPVLKNRSGDLLLYTEQKAEKISCPKGHQVGIMTVGKADDESYGFFEPHCKLYSREVEHRGRVLKIASRFRGLTNVH